MRSRNDLRLLASWTFEDGESFVLYCTNKAKTADVLDMLEQMIAIRRTQLADNERTPSAPVLGR